MCLCTKNTPTSLNICHIGSLNASLVHPREVFKAAILSNSASIIVGHWHPSGDPAPSKEDVEVTKRLLEVGKIIGIEVLDHIIIGDGRFESLKEKGYL
jgi:DNA repair protein RadC